MTRQESIEQYVEGLRTGNLDLIVGAMAKTFEFVSPFSGVIRKDDRAVGASSKHPHPVRRRS